MIHAVKCDSEYFQALKSGNKTFEVRKNDRQYRVGDYIAVNEHISGIDPYSVDDNTRMSNDGTYTGECLLFRITYVLHDRPDMLQKGFVVLGLFEIEI